MLKSAFGSLLASVPAWRHIDPLPVLGRDDDGEEEEWYEPNDRDADANELAIANVLEGSLQSRMGIGLECERPIVESARTAQRPRI